MSEHPPSRLRNPSLVRSTRDQAVRRVRRTTTVVGAGATAAAIALGLLVASGTETLLGPAGLHGRRRADDIPARGRPPRRALWSPTASTDAGSSTTSWSAAGSSSSTSSTTTTTTTTTRPVTTSGQTS